MQHSPALHAIHASPTPALLYAFLEKIIDKKVDKIALSIFEKITDFICYYLYSSYSRRLEFRLKQNLAIQTPSPKKDDMPLHEETEVVSEKTKTKTEAAAQKIASPVLSKPAQDVSPADDVQLDLKKQTPLADPAASAAKKSKLDALLDATKQKNELIKDKMSAIIRFLESDDSTIGLSLVDRLSTLVSFADEELSRQLDIVGYQLDLDFNRIDYVYFYSKYNKRDDWETSLIRASEGRRAYLKNLLDVLRSLQDIYNRGDIGFKIGTLWNEFELMEVNSDLFDKPQYTADIPSRLKKLLTLQNKTEVESELDNIMADLKIPYLGKKGLK